MKFSAFTSALNTISLKMMGISCPARNQIGAIGSNDLIEGTNSFWDTLGTILLRTVEDVLVTIYEIIAKLVYAVAKWLLTVIDFVFIFIRQMIGLNTDYKSLEDISKSDMIFQFVFNDTVISVIRGMLAFAIVLLILFSIIAILKSEFDYAQRGGSNSKKQILVRSLRSLFLMILVPVISIGAIVLSNAVLRSLYIATAGGADTSMGSQIFIAAGYNANAYRRYAGNNLKIPITFNFDEVSDSDNVTGWGTDGGVAELDEALQAFKSSDVWNRGLTTFLMFYTDAFLQMDTVDKLNSLAKEQGKTSNYHANYDKGIYTRAEEYYVMADVIDYSMKNRQAIYFKTAEEIYESYYSVYNMVPSSAKNQMGTIMPIQKVGGNYTFTIYFDGDSSATTYTHEAGAKDEAKGAVFLVALEKQLTVGDKVYTYYYPLLSTEENFATDYYARTKQPVIAKGLFEKGENPTALKVEDGVVKCYRDDLNVPTLVDFFPTISYEMPEGVTEDFNMKILKTGFKAATGVNADDFIPYVYYSFDIFNLFTKKSYNIVKLDKGYMLVDYNFSQKGYEMTNLYKLGNTDFNGGFNFIILIFASVLILTMLLKMLFGLALRVLDVTLLAITYPAVLSTFPLDGGDRFKGWVDTFLKKLLSIYGIVVGVNVVLLILPIIDGLELITPSMIDRAISLRLLPSSLTSRFLNCLVTLLFTMVAFTSIGGFGKTIEALITNQKEDEVGGVMADGESVVNDLQNLPKKIGHVVSGQIVIDTAKSAVKTATSFIPGSAIVADIHEKAQHRKDQMFMQDNIDGLKRQTKKGDTTGFEDDSKNQENSASTGGVKNTGSQTGTSQNGGSGVNSGNNNSTNGNSGGGNTSGGSESASGANSGESQQTSSGAESANDVSGRDGGMTGTTQQAEGASSGTAGDVAEVAETMFGPTDEAYRPAKDASDMARERGLDETTQPQTKDSAPVTGDGKSEQASEKQEAPADTGAENAEEASGEEAEDGGETDSDTEGGEESGGGIVQAVEKKFEENSEEAVEKQAEDATPMKFVPKGIRDHIAHQDEIDAARAFGDEKKAQELEKQGSGSDTVIGKALDKYDEIERKVKNPGGDNNDTEAGKNSPDDNLTGGGNH